MRMIISPAKNMKMPEKCLYTLGVPEFQNKTLEIWDVLQKLNPWELESVLKVNEKLAVQAFLDYKAFMPLQIGMADKHRAALTVYDGLVFKNIEADTFSDEDMMYAQEHLRILSGFYGVLKPLDGIMPYRLEMMCKIKIGDKGLYPFWNRTIYESVCANQSLVLNLASEEYAKCVRKYLEPWDRMVDVEFLVYKSGKLKTVTAWAKMARGCMVRYIIKNRIDDIEGVKKFDDLDYQFMPELSHERKLVFVIK